MTVFGIGDLVSLKNMKNKDLDGCDAVIVETHVNQGSDVKNYGLYVKDSNCETYWVHEDNMDLQERNQLSLVDEWEEELKNNSNSESDDSE